MSPVMLSSKSYWMFLAMLYCPIALRSEIDSNRIEDEVAHGTKLITQRRFAEATEVFNRLKQVHPKDARPYFYLGMTLSQTGRVSAAASELSEAVRLDPTKPEYRLFQADVLTRLGHRALALEAIALFKSNKAANQLTTAWLWLLSDVYYRLEQNDDALRILEILSKRNPNDPRNDLNRGQVYMVKGNQELAQRFFEKSIERNPSNNAQAYFELGKILHQKDEMTLAKNALLVAVKQEGTNCEYLEKLAVVCLARNELDEAIEYLRRAEPAGTRLPEIYYNLGRAYQKKGDRAKAEDYLKKFGEATSKQRNKKNRSREAGNLISLGEKQMDQGNKAQARVAFEQALQVDPENWDAHGYLAEMLLESGDLELAKPHLLKMEELDPDAVVGNYLTATYWYRCKDLEMALRYADRAKSSQPDNSELRNLLGNIYSGMGREKEALEEYEAAVRLSTDRSDYRHNLEILRSRTLKANSEPKDR
jgi:tetratricopeptide (TPR) repeat protein